MPSLSTTVAPFEAENVRGYLHKAGDVAAGDGMVLTHGAGGNCNAPLLVAVADAFQTAGLNVLRCALPYRQQKPSGPPPPAEPAKDRAGLPSAGAAPSGTPARRRFVAAAAFHR